MTKEEKMTVAKRFYDGLDLSNYHLDIRRDDEIKADYIWISGMRGPSGLIIGDDGSYLFCQSIHGYDYWKEEFKKGIRSPKEDK